MERRHGGEQPVVGREAALPHAVAAAVDHVAVGELDPLGTGGGARGEDDHGRIAHVQVAGRGRLVGADGHGFVEIDHALAERVSRPVGDEHMGHGVGPHALAGGAGAGALGAGRILAVAALAVGLGHHHGDAALLVHEDALLQLVLHVDGHGHGANLRQGHAHGHVLGRVVQLHGHVVALAHAEAREVVGHAVDVAVELPVGEGTHLAGTALVGEEKMIAAAGGKLVPQIAEILVAYDDVHGLGPRPLPSWVESRRPGRLSRLHRQGPLTPAGGPSKAPSSRRSGWRPPLPAPRSARGCSRASSARRRCRRPWRAWGARSGPASARSGASARGP